MDEDLKKLIEVIDNINSSIETMKMAKCSCNEYTGHTCDRCILINKLNAVAIDTSETITRILKGDAENE
jgi:hypothetical protein